MPYVATSVSDLLARLKGSIRLDGEHVAVVDESTLRGDGIRDLAWTSVFSTEAGATSRVNQGPAPTTRTGLPNTVSLPDTA